MNYKNKKIMIPTKEENPLGLHSRYYVSKVSGEPVDENAEYFVLRLDKNASDLLHVDACRCAIMTYATIIEKTQPKLAKDLKNKYSDRVSSL